MTASHTDHELVQVPAETAGRHRGGVQSQLARAIWVGTSRRVALGLMIATITAIALQLLVPQHRNALPGEYAAWNARYGEISNVLVLVGVDRVTSTPWFRTIVLLMSASMALSSVLRGWRLVRTGPAVRSSVRYSRSIAGDTDFETVAERLRQNRFRISASKGAIHAHRGALAAWGSIAFHFGIVVIVAGSVVTSLAAFTGYVELAPGQLLISGDQATGGADYIVTNSHAEPEMSIQLDEVEVERWPNGDAKQVRALVTVLSPDGTTRSETVTRNNPLSVGKADVTLGSPMGTAVRFTYIDENDAVTSGYVNLPNTRTNAVPSVVRVPGTGFDVTIRHAQGSEPGDTVHVEYTDAVGQVRLLQREEAIAIGEGRLVFDGLETWALFMVSKDPGFSVMVAGGIASIAGLAFALFISPVTLSVRKAAGSVVIEQRSRMFVPDLTHLALELPAETKQVRHD